MMDQELLKEKYKLLDLERLLIRCENEIADAIEQRNLKENNDNSTFLLYTIGKSFVSTREVIILCWSGYPDGALSIARNVFEQFIITAYVESKDLDEDFSKLLERYNDNYNVQRAKNLRFEAKRVREDANKISEYDQEIEMIERKYDAKTNRDYWWTLEKNITSFSDLCDNVVNQNKEIEKMIRTMQIMYKRACVSLHSSCMGNRIRLGSDFAGIDMGPWESGQGSSLYLVTSSLIFIVGTTYQLLGLESKEVMRSFNELAILYLNLIQKSDSKERKGANVEN